MRAVINVAVWEFTVSCFVYSISDINVKSKTALILSKPDHKIPKDIPIFFAVNSKSNELGQFAINF